MKHDIVPTLSNAALDVLLPLPKLDDEIDTGYLTGFLRRLTTALDNAQAGALDQWAWNAIHNYPSVPSEAEVAEQFPPFTMPMPEWAV